MGRWQKERKPLPTIWEAPDELVGGDRAVLRSTTHPRGSAADRPAWAFDAINLSVAVGVSVERLPLEYPKTVRCIGRSAGVSWGSSSACGRRAEPARTRWL